MKKQAKADKRLNKAADWYDSMESVLGKTTLSNITNSRSVNLSQKYSGYLESLRPDTLRTMNNAYQAMNLDEEWKGRYLCTIL